MDVIVALICAVGFLIGMLLETDNAQEARKERRDLEEKLIKRGWALREMDSAGRFVFKLKSAEDIKAEEKIKTWVSKQLGPTALVLATITHELMSKAKIAIERADL